MQIIKILPESNGSHVNQHYDSPIIVVPDGWAIVPNDMPIPDTFPFVNIEVTDGIVTSMEAGVIPPVPPEPDPDPSADELLDLLLGVTTDE